MPFTISHTVVAIPLYKLLGQYGALSALIIGSMTPDLAYISNIFLKIFWYFTDIWVDEHSIQGVFVNSIPMGLTVFFLFHLFMAPVFVSLFPKKLKQYIPAYLFIGKTPNIPFHIITLSLIIGALTHIFWDFFTHQYGIPQYINWMNQPLTSIDGYDIMPYRLLQHFSTLFGLSLLLFLIWRWYQYKNKQTPAQSTYNYWDTPKKLKILSALFILTVSTIAGIKGGLSHLPETDVMYGIYRIQVFVRFGIVWAAGGFIASSILMGVIYKAFIYRNNQHQLKQ